MILIKIHVLNASTTPVWHCFSPLRCQFSFWLCRAAAMYARVCVCICVSVSFMMSIGIRCLLNLAAREQSEEPDMT